MERLWIKRKTYICKDIGIPVFTAALFTVANHGDNQCPLIDDWIKKVWYIYTMEHYPAIRKDKILTFVITWMDHGNSMLSEVSRQKKLRTVRFHSHVGYKPETHRQITLW